MFGQKENSKEWKKESEKRFTHFSLYFYDMMQLYVRKLAQLLLISFFVFSSCEEKFEPIQRPENSEFQPLLIGNFWIYEVDQTIHFGENDFETERFFYRDRIRSFYLNAETEPVYIIERSKSLDKINWQIELEYTLQQKENLIIRTIQNQPVIILNLPVLDGKIWNGNVFSAAMEDEFELKIESEDQIRILQENLDDKITIRDIRYEVFQKNIGLIEKFDNVVTYCSRNDCLGKELIDSGYRIHLTLIEYGKS